MLNIMRVAREKVEHNIITQMSNYFVFSGIAALANIISRFLLSTAMGANFYLAVDSDVALVSCLHY